METVKSRGFSASRFDVIPNAVVPPNTAELQHGTVPAFLYAGRLSPEKGLDLLLTAAQRAGVRLVIAGDGPMRDAVAALPFVEYVGLLDPEALGRARERTTGAVVPSCWYENAPMAVLECMASSRVVVATAIGGIPEIARHEREALLVPPADVAALASALTRLAQDTRLATELGRRGRVRALSRFSPKAHTSRLLAVYTDRRIHD